MPQVTVVDHPLVQHKLSVMRREDTPPITFRQLAAEVSMLLTYEVTRDLPTQVEPIRTPVAPTSGKFIGSNVVLVSVLRAGNGFLDGMLQMIPTACVGHVGIYRDEATLEAVEYYIKLPKEITGGYAIVVDPMLATGNSAIAVVNRLKAAQPRSIRFVSLVSAPEGIKHLHTEHPDVPLFTAAIDSHLNDHGYIVPGLGDAGDRLFGTT